IILSPAGALEHELDRLAEEVRVLVRTTGATVLRIGRALVQARALLRARDESFDAWCLEQLGMSRSTSYRFTQVAEAFDGAAAELGSSFEASALYLLAAGDVPDAARKEALERAERGETITASRARDLARQHAHADDDPEPFEEPSPA